jgi:glutamate-1-semialdehyde 2,1-aminomutase
MDLVAPSGPVYQAGTLSANPVAVRAGLATLEKMERLDGWSVLNERTTRFCEGLRSAMRAGGGRPQVVQQGSLFWLTLPGGVDRDWFARLFHLALQEGVYLPPSGYEVCFLSMAHDAASLDAAAGVLARAAEAAGRS